MLALLGGMKLAGVDVIDLFKDTIELSESDRRVPWKGAFGAVGALGWIAASTCCLLTSSVLPRENSDRRYLGAAGLVFLVLGLDDALVIHDHLAPYLTGTERSEKVVLGLLGLMVVSWAVRFRSHLRRSDLVLLVMSAVGLGGAFAIDPLQSVGLALPGIGLVEEVVEFLGLVALVAWASTEARRALLGREAQADAGEAR